MTLSPSPARPARPAAPALDLSAENLRAVRAILHRRIPEVRVVAYGSRARGRARKFSDLDLAIVSARPVDGKIIALLANDFTQSNLPIRVDISEWRRFSQTFRRAIADHCVTIQESA